MNKDFKKIVWASAALLCAATACEKPLSEDTSTESEAVPGSKMTLNISKERADAFQKGDRISLYAWTFDGDNLPGETHAKNVRMELGDKGEWKSRPALEFKDQTSPHRFLGIYPFHLTPIRNFRKATFQLGQQLEKNDLMIAVNNQGITNGTEVELKFMPMTSRLYLHLYTGRRDLTAAPAVHLKTRTGAQIDYFGKADAPVMKVTGETGNYALVPQEDPEAATAGIYRYEALLLPQDDNKSFLIGSGAEAIAYDLKEALRLEPGKSVTIDLYLDDHLVSHSSTTYGLWEEEGELIKKNLVSPGQVNVLNCGHLSAEELAQALGEGEQVQISGRLTASDLRVIREAAGCSYQKGKPGNREARLKKLDLSQAHILAGEDSYMTDETLGQEFRITAENTLGEGLFQGSVLQEIILPSKLTAIGAECFQNSSNLQQLELPEKCTSLGASCLSGTNLRHLTLPAGITDIQASFISGTHIQHLVVKCPASDRILPEAWKGFDSRDCIIQVEDSWGRRIETDLEGFVKLDGQTWSQMKTLHDDPLLTINAKEALITCAIPSVLSAYSIHTAMDVDTRTLHISGPLDGTDIEILRSFCRGTAAGESNNPWKDVLKHLDLKTVRFKASDYSYGKSITDEDIDLKISRDDELGPETFAYCGLESLTLPRELKYIGDQAFIYSNLPSITIPEKVIGIGNYIFNRSLLESVQFLCHQPQLGRYIFNQCSKLTTVQLSPDCNTIGYGMFDGCKALTTLNIPSSVTTLDGICFKETGLQELIIPATVKVIKLEFLKFNTTLHKLTFMGTPELNTDLWNLHPFDNFTNIGNCDLVIPEAWSSKVSGTPDQPVFDGFTWKSITYLP